jgi:hypothetical protein
MATKSWSSFVRTAVLAGGLSVIFGAIGNGQQVLGVRTGVGFRYQLSQVAGEEQLAVISKTARAEDAWLYIGDAWVDIGYEEKPNSVLLDLRVVADAMNGRDPSQPLAFYHIHPFCQDPCNIEPPSLQDIHSLALMKEACGGQVGASMVGVIFDGRGKWTFDITVALERRILHDEHGRTSVEGDSGNYAASHGYVDRPDSTSVFDLKYALNLWSAILLEASATRDDRIVAFIRAVRQQGVTVTYTPIRP